MIIFRGTAIFDQHNVKAKLDKYVTILQQPSLTMVSSAVIKYGS